MNEILKAFLFTGDKFMSELHLRQPGFTYNECRPLTKHYERIQYRCNILSNILFGFIKELDNN